MAACWPAAEVFRWTTAGSGMTAMLQGGFRPRSQLDRSDPGVRRREMKTYHDAAYAMAALSAATVVFRVLVNKGLLTREDAVRALLDEAVARAIFAESKLAERVISETTAELNRQSAEILKIVAEGL
jgi:hypothetical protein